jgi:DNA modification methylase
MKRFHPTHLLPEMRPSFKTPNGAAYQAEAQELLSRLPDDSVDLVLTSPPYALHFKKEYGNVDQDKYVDWMLGFAPQIRRVLKNDGSFVLNIGGSWTPGQPTRSLCHFEIALRLVKEAGFFLAQEFFWYNPAKLPVPAEWVNVRKIRVKDSVECVWWLSKTPYPRANNQSVLRPYSADMKRLLQRGYRATVRPSGHVITEKFINRGGSIPGNLLSMGNNDATGHYLARCKAEGVKPHPARFPPQLPAFFVRLLCSDSSLILDPFAGSCTTGEVAENMGKHWICCDLEPTYLRGARFRFEEPWDEDRRNQVLGELLGYENGAPTRPEAAQASLSFTSK